MKKIELLSIDNDDADNKDELSRCDERNEQETNGNTTRELFCNIVEQKHPVDMTVNEFCFQALEINKNN
jgi:hypothetical protein